MSEVEKLQQEIDNLKTEIAALKDALRALMQRAEAEVLTIRDVYRTCKQIVES